MTVVTVAVEGDGDVPVVRRLLQRVGLTAGTIYGLGGKDRLDARLAAYNAAARHSRWLVLRDLNSDADCAPRLRQRLLPEPSEGMSLRIAVRGVESWLLADRQRMSRFLAVPAGHVPAAPDLLQDPKRALVDLARYSRRSAVRADMIPGKGTSARVGPGYTARLIEFASDIWEPVEAAQHSPSLFSCLAALRRWLR